MAKKFDIQYYFSEGFHSIFTHGFMSFAAVCMIVACLLIMGSFTLVAVNLDNMLGDLEAENEFLAYVDESYTEEQARDIKSQIEAIPNVSQVTFVTRAEAMDDFRAGRENNELLADLPDEVLRDRFRIHVQDIKQLKATSEQVQKITGVADVNAAYDIAQGFVLVRNIATGVAAVLVAMLAVVSLFIIANTIKLTVYNRRLEIYIMKSVGATNGFIRFPFAIEGVVLGLLAALLSYGIIAWVYSKLASLFSFGISFSPLTFSDVWAVLLVGFLVIGMLTGIAGSAISMTKYLKDEGGSQS